MHTTPNTLTEWLAHCERLHPQSIAMGLERVRKSRRMELRFDCPVITVAGTNGKGSTCAMLEAVALQSGYRPVSTPRRIWCTLKSAAASTARSSRPRTSAAFRGRGAARLQGEEVLLTYFEFTTLAILRLLSLARLDVAILEVGLGGRLDATNVIDADCAIITSIDIDHAESWARPREHRPRKGRHHARRPPGGRQRPGAAAKRDRSRAIGADLWRFGRTSTTTATSSNGLGRPWPAMPAGLSGAARRQSADECLGRAGGLEAMRDRLPVTAQAVRTGWPWWSCPGASRSCPASPRWCWTWRTTRIRWRR
jgi:dihydrofolate synthase/folylpolyglutamate synthase